MDIKKFKRDLKIKPNEWYLLELYYKGTNVGGVCPCNMNELYPVEIEKIINGVYRISSGGITVIADEYRKEW